MPLLRQPIGRTAYLAKASQRFRWATQRVRHRAESIHTPDTGTLESVFDARRQVGQAHYRLFRFQRRGHRLLLRLRSSSPFGHHNPDSGVHSLDLHLVVFPVGKDIRSRLHTRKRESHRRFPSPNRIRSVQTRNISMGLSSIIQRVELSPSRNQHYLISEFTAFQL
jgi:hypothetical protein